MYKRIMVPLDGSKPSLAAFEEIIRFAREQGASLSLLFVCEDPQYVVAEGPVNLMALRRHGEAILSRPAKMAREAGIETEIVLLDAQNRRVAEAIVDEAKHRRADLIAMGTHGRHGVQHLMLGSVAEGVLRRSEMPVLVLRGI